MLQKIFVAFITIIEHPSFGRSDNDGHSRKFLSYSENSRYANRIVMSKALPPLQSKTIGSAAYNSAWYNLKPKESRLLLFIIARAQKQITLTAGKMMDLNLETFTSVRFTLNNTANIQQFFSHKRD